MLQVLQWTKRKTRPSELPGIIYNQAFTLPGDTYQTHSECHAKQAAVPCPGTPHSRTQRGRVFWRSYKTLDNSKETQEQCSQ